MIFRYNFIKSMTKLSHFFKILVFCIFLIILSSCEALKYKKTEAGEVPVNAKDRVQKNIEEGRGFRLFGNEKKGGTFDFASSNELWRATLDTIDFMPLASVNYSGGIIITDWYSNNQNPNESIKITIRFLTNEIRSDALDIKVFTKKCTENFNCQTYETNQSLAPELTRQILKTAAIYEKEKIEKKKTKNKDYKYPNLD